MRGPRMLVGAIREVGTGEVYGVGRGNILIVIGRYLVFVEFPEMMTVCGVSLVWLNDRLCRWKCSCVGCCWLVVGACGGVEVAS